MCGYRWSADRTAAWRLLDGEVVCECPLDEASDILSRLGLGYGTPPVYAPRRESEKAWARAGSKGRAIARLSSAKRA